MPDKPDMALASMGIYVFETQFLIDQLRRDAADPNSSRDFGKDIIPYLVKHGKAVAHRFARSCVRSTDEAEAYWRDVGTIDAYWEANIDLADPVPALDLYDRSWPIWTYGEITPPAKFVHDDDGPPRHGGRFARLRRLHHLRRGAAPLAALHRRARPFLCAASRTPSSCPMSTSAAQRAAVERRGRPRRAHPGGTRRRRGPRARRAALPPHASAASA